MSKTTTVTATIEHKEEKMSGKFPTVKLTLVNGLQKDVVDCYPTKAEKVNVGDFVVATWTHKYTGTEDKKYENKQVAHIEIITASSQEMKPEPTHDGHSNIASYDIPF
jgi:hypothetical protein